MQQAMTNRDKEYGSGPPRYAIYAAPEEDSGLARFGSAWLGRDAAGNETAGPPVLAGAAPERLREITALPRHYGFHATLKPPFPLAAGRSPDDLLRAVQDFACGRRPVAVAGLRLAEIGRFLALVPAGGGGELKRLAASCVKTFDPFRAPATAEEIKRRKERGLTPAQENLLRRWGYPYVLEEFRFHFTLTGPLADKAEKARLARGLAAVTEKFRRLPFRVKSICVFFQPSPARPFSLLKRFALGGRGGAGRSRPGRQPSAAPLDR